jgi:hypothetical protein
VTSAPRRNEKSRRRAGTSARAARSALSLAAPALMSSPRVRTPITPVSGPPACGVDPAYAFRRGRAGVPHAEPTMPAVAVDEFAALVKIGASVRRVKAWDR